MMIRRWDSYGNGIWVLEQNMLVKNISFHIKIWNFIEWPNGERMSVQLCAVALTLTWLTNTSVLGIMILY